MSSINDDVVPCDRCPLRPSTWASGFQDACSECRLHVWTDEERADFLLWLVARQAKREGLAFTDGET